MTGKEREGDYIHIDSKYTLQTQTYKWTPLATV